MLAIFTYADTTTRAFEVSAVMGATLLTFWKAVQTNTATLMPQTFLTLAGMEVPARWSEVRALIVTELPPPIQP